MASSWDMNTSRGKPGGQGSLFSVGDKDALLNPQQRWPKGYTPQRREEVKTELDKVPVEGRYEADAGHQRGRVLDVVSRSTIPAHHLRGLKSVGADALEGTSGTYWGARSHLAVNMLDRRKWEGDQAGQTLVHELGHHWDARNTYHPGASPTLVQVHREDRAKEMWPHEGEPNISTRIMAEKDVERGVKEAVADNYMEKHYRTPGRNPQPVTEGRYEATGNADKPLMQPGYRAVRPAKNLGPQFKQEGLF